MNGKTESILANAKGLPLYYFQGDTAKKSNVSGALLRLWPALVSAHPVGTGTPGKLTALQSANGHQVTYNGRFLYTFIDDTPGHVNGQGVSGFFVATPHLKSINGSTRQPPRIGGPATARGAMATATEVGRPDRFGRPRVLDALAPASGAGAGTPGRAAKGFEGGPLSSWWPQPRRLAVFALLVASKREALTKSLGRLGHSHWSWVPIAIGLELTSMAAFALMQGRLLRAGGKRLGHRPMMATILAANALSVSVPMAGPELGTAFTFRRFKTQGAPTFLASWCLLVGGLVSWIGAIVVLVAGGALSGNDLVTLLALVAALVVVAAGVTLAGEPFTRSRTASPVGASVGVVGGKDGEPPAPPDGGSEPEPSEDGSTTCDHSGSRHRVGQGRRRWD